MAETTCPECKGRKIVTALVDFADSRKSGATVLLCSGCKGRGKIDLEQQRWQRIGGVHRTWRVAQWEGQRECAIRLGITVRVLVDMEHGRLDPTRLLQDTPDALRDAS